MKTKSSLIKGWIFMLFCILLSSCFKNRQTADNQVQYGIATINGKISGAFPDTPKEIALACSHPIFGERIMYRASVTEDGYFTFKIPVVCNSIGYIYSTVSDGMLCLIPNDETKLEIFYDENEVDKAQIRITDNSGLLPKDFDDMQEVSDNVYMNRWNDDTMCVRSVMLPADYSKFAMHRMNTELSMIENSDILSVKSKQILYYAIKLFELRSDFFDYERIVSPFIQNTDKEIKADDFIPDKSYYSFLKDFDLNNSLYLYANDYSSIMQFILSNETFQIPAIEETPVNEWLRIVKTNIADLVGFDTGLFYDMLAANAYSRQ